MYRPYTTITKRPSEIRFSQDSIHHKFRRRSGHGKDSVNDTLDKILSGQLSETDLPRIEVAEKDGELYTLGNRRLYIFRVLELKGKLDSIRVDVVSSLRRDLTTINDGVSIVMRYDNTRAHAHAAPIPKPKEIVDKLLDELLLQVINSASQHTTKEAGTSISRFCFAIIKNDVETKADDVETKADDVITKDDDVEIKVADVETKDDDVETKGDDVETQDNDVETKSDVVKIKDDDVVTKVDDEETKDDDVEVKVDDVETKDATPSFDSDADVFTVEINRMPSQLGKHGHVEPADTSSESEPEAKRSKT